MTRIPDWSSLLAEDKSVTNARWILAAFRYLHTMHSTHLTPQLVLLPHGGLTLSETPLHLTQDLNTTSFWNATQCHGLDSCVAFSQLKLKNGRNSKMANWWMCICAYIFTQSIKYRLSGDSSLSPSTTFFHDHYLHLLSFLFSCWFTLQSHLCFICLPDTIPRTLCKQQCWTAYMVFQDTHILNTKCDHSEGKLIYGYNTLKCPDYTLKLFEVQRFSHLGLLSKDINGKRQ